MKDGKQALMNNKDKAMEIAGCCTCNDPFCCVRFSEGQENSGCNRFCDALEMAEWKDEQTKQLIIEFSKWLNERGFFKEDLQCDLEHQARTFLDKKGFSGAYE